MICSVEIISIDSVIFLQKQTLIPLSNAKVLEVFGYKFYFYSNEGNEPPHIHVTKGNGNSKYWLEPEVREEYSYGFTVRERRDIRNIINQHYQFLIKKWYESF